MEPSGPKPGAEGDRAAQGRADTSPVSFGVHKGSVALISPRVLAFRRLVSLRTLVAMASLDGASAGMEDPFGSRLRSLLQAIAAPTWTIAFEDKTFVAGLICGIDGEHVSAKIFRFFPHKGFSVDPALGRDFDLVLPRIADRPANMYVGAHILCLGPTTKVTDTSIEFDTNVAVGTRPDMVEDMSWSALHLFAGAFSGWTQAARWISQAKCGITIGQEIEVDAAIDVASTWAADNCHSVLTAPVAPFGTWSPADRIRILGQVRDHTILNLCQHQVNLIATLSPPCQSWSKGGKQAGLLSSNGIAFVDGLVCAFCSQANLIVAECVDDLMHHPHFATLKNLAASLGYKLAWMQIASLHQISPHMRNRWLCAWVRADVQSVPLPTTFTLAIRPNPSWTDDAYRFCLPRTWQAQILLSDTEKQAYGAVDLLPPAKRKQFHGKQPSLTEVLHSRVANEQEPLPTLCASYTTQHQLAGSHLAAKGIFATLQMTPQGFAFIDPAVFISLLGATSDLIMPSKIGEAFRFIGNGIAIPHAALSLLIGFQTVLPLRLDIIGLVRSCWLDRLTSRNSALFQQGDWIYMIRHSSAPKHLTACCTQGDHGPFKVLVTLHNKPEHGIGLFQGHHTCDHCLKHLVKGPWNLIWHLCLSHDGTSHSQAQTLQELISKACNWSILCADTVIGQMTISDTTTQQALGSRPKSGSDNFHEDVSPTIPFVPHLGHQPEHFQAQ